MPKHIEEMVVYHHYEHITSNLKHKGPLSGDWERRVGYDPNSSSVAQGGHFWDSKPPYWWLPAQGIIVVIAQGMVCSNLKHYNEKKDKICLRVKVSISFSLRTLPSNSTIY